VVNQNLRARSQTSRMVRISVNTGVHDQSVVLRFAEVTAACRRSRSSTQSSWRELAPHKRSRLYYRRPVVSKFTGPKLPGVMVWLSGNRWSRSRGPVWLVLGWVTFAGLIGIRVILVFDESPKSTQPGHLSVSTTSRDTVGSQCNLVSCCRL